MIERNERITILEQHLCIGSIGPGPQHLTTNPFVVRPRALPCVPTAPPALVCLSWIRRLVPWPYCSDRSSSWLRTGPSRAEAGRARHLSAAVQPRVQLWMQTRTYLKSGRDAAGQRLVSTPRSSLTWRCHGDDVGDESLQHHRHGSRKWHLLHGLQHRRLCQRRHGGHDRRGGRADRVHAIPKLTHHQGKHSARYQLRFHWSM